MKQELLRIMDQFYLESTRRYVDNIAEEIKKNKIYHTRYIKNALKCKYSRVWVVVKLDIKLDHYGRIKEK